MEFELVWGVHDVTKFVAESLLKCEINRLVQQLFFAPGVIKLGDSQ